MVLTAAIMARISTSSLPDNGVNYSNEQYWHALPPTKPKYRDDEPTFRATVARG